MADDSSILKVDIFIIILLTLIIIFVAGYYIIKLLDDRLDNLTSSTQIDPSKKSSVSDNKCDIPPIYLNLDKKRIKLNNYIDKDINKNTNKNTLTSTDIIEDYGNLPDHITEVANSNYQQISNKVDELYKRMQQESSNSSLLNEYKNLRAQRDELGAKLPPEAQQVQQSLLEQSYKGSHTAPKADVYGATFDNLQGIMPSNVYSQEGKRLYGLGDSKVDSEWYMSALRVKGKPDADVTIYRAVPKGVKDINDGDWVTPSKEYARLHGERTLDGDYEILSKKVKARTLSTEGYPYELGYNEIVVK